MGKRSKEVDAYIERARPFARPILKKLRGLFHKGCPKLEEKMKWGAPSYEHQGIIGMTPAFKEHVRCVFWNKSMLREPEKSLARSMMAGKFKLVSDLPGDAKIVAVIREVAGLNVKGIKMSRKVVKRPPPKTPGDFLKALKKNGKAMEVFEGFSPSHKREYVEWIMEAKRAETRERRIGKAIEMLEEGKSQNWKYERG
jgi:uncharacterized protein YdeI (YjbR/CyaY-like superfamily)